MCTVTFLPKKNGQYLLTSNRDEAPHRSPENITTDFIGGQQLAFPRDEEAGGTWIVMSGADRLVCILNGAFEKHDRKPPYRRSRGLMALDYFLYPNVDAFIADYELIGMEPFTMILCECGRLVELVWDEKQAHVTELDASAPHIWSSSTLYEAEVKTKRKAWFDTWLKEHSIPYKRDQILHFHRTAGDGDTYNDVVMNRNNIVRTVSITSIEKGDNRMDMRYHDLLRERVRETKIVLKGECVESR